ncbi:MAG TPA: pyruvate dehydrogenase complex dihydrolipoamide acetyltransferase [Bacteroidia bacterium]|jgi:pyruvate dehydrogenase E2 component (dihydrolipoamide acetyltransferase)|nr:pyruvate dehydrogenase complex dihydrolipoamide acetyltransferase [Bacteroidia bacterium]
MAEVIKMPKLSDTMTEGVVAKWHKKVGDKVKNGELLADIETDKATMEFESFYDGVLLHIGVEAGKAVAIDSLLAIIGKEGEDIKGLIEANKQPASDNGQEVKIEKKTENKEEVKSEAKSEKSEGIVKPEIPTTVNIIRMPKLSDTMTEGVVAKWHKKVGDKVKNGELLADIETDKATMEFESFFDGVLLYVGTEAGKPAAIDSLLAIVGKGGEDVSKIVEYEKSAGNKKSEVKSQEPVSATTAKQTAVAEVKTQQPVKVAEHANTNGRIKASPLAKKIAKDKGIDLAVVHGSGDFGRIIKKDIEFFNPSVGKSIPAFVGTESFTDEPVSQMRKVIAKRLVESVVNAPHFYLTMEIDMDHCIASREAINKIQDVKISYNDIVIKACAAALRKHPKVNGAWMGDKIRYNHHIHIGMAVAVEDGLLVPVIRFADGKSLQEISTEAKDFGKRAKEKKLQPKDWEGNTFTVSNLGMFGIDEFTSIINTPEACILAVGGIKQVPVVKSGAIVPGNTMKITLSCDHRVVDGATGAAFLQTLKVFLENPVTMFV